MRVVVTGGRDYFEESLIFKFLGNFFISELATGGCKTGADFLATKYAKVNGIPFKTFPVQKQDWIEHGLSAGPLRNQRMLVEFKPDAVIAFPGHRGTKDCVTRARKLGIEVIQSLEYEHK